MNSRWISFRQNISKIGVLSLPRWINFVPDSPLQLHMFADASRRAMAATVYSLTNHTTHLLAAKTKLTPIKSLLPPKKPNARMTIPRLELRAALLGAKLIKKHAEALGVEVHDCHAWSDSQIVLNWLASNEPVGNDLVDNYVAHIQELIPGVKWRYVPSEDNPADLATRGTDTESLAPNQLWWQGTPWLRQDTDTWPRESTARSTDVPNIENQPPIQCFTVMTTTTIISRFSSLLKLLRALVRCRRLFQSRITPSNSTSPLAPTTIQETKREFLNCVKISQQQDFEHEVQLLGQDKSIPKNNVIARLNPFLDEEKVLRVGGRLENSALCDEEKHPPLLTSRSHLAELIIDWAHQRALHAGSTVTYAYALKRAWIIGGRAKVKSFVRRCIVCAKTSRRTSTQLMADLPAVRVNPSRPFSKVGVDYAGPFQILRSKGRGIRSSKGYVAVFVCLVTKAIHLELVGDLTTESFLGTLSRFTGRRGNPAEIWSDNATNFRGADLELKRMFLEARIDWNKVEESLTQSQIKWSFIPPSTPHFGGLWEAGVKSMKTQLRRVAGTRKLTYEEFSTLLVEIEMVLNSRPMIPLSGELDDLDALTPGHFLVGTALTSIPQPSSTETNLDRLTHWKLARGMRDHFWHRWSSDYLNTLQQRTKWTRPRTDLKIGDMVIVKDTSLLGTNGHWPLGRVIQTHRGANQLVRVATIKTQRGVYVRPVTKLIHLPVTSTSSDQTGEPETARSKQ